VNVFLGKLLTRLYELMSSSCNVSNVSEYIA
jgi:hypothetical protein